jgi:hypothetical protein
MFSGDHPYLCIQNTLMMEAEKVSEMFNICSELTRLIVHDDGITFVQYKSGTYLLLLFKLRMYPVIYIIYT